MAAPLIAIVGRPNVGKSTLYNRIIGGRPALVHDTPGLTRDRRYGEFDYFGRKLRLVDTGGLDPEAERDVIGAGIHRQAWLAIEESDAIVFVVDATAGVTPGDADLCRMLRKANKPIFLAANKIDGPKRDSLANDLYTLGLGEVYPVSAAHGRGVDDLLQTMVDALGLAPAPEPDPDEDDEDGPLRIAFVGKPNAGKSSLVNRLLGTERALVHHVPGTTTDPVDTPFEFGGRSYVLIDTAGIRRRARIDAETEKISVSLAINQVRRAHVVVLVVDGMQSPSEQDARLAGAIEERGRAMVIALNKSDLLTKASQSEALKKKTSDEMHFLKWVPQVMTSALRGDGMGDLLDKVDAVSVEHRRRIQTAELNRFFEEVCETHPPPLHKGRSVRIKYLTQARAKPPTFVLMVNRPDGISPSYRRYLVNQLRARYGFVGTPLRMLVRASSKRKYGRKKGKGRR